MEHEGADAVTADATLEALSATSTDEPRWCLNCHDDGPLRPWPLPDEWGDVGIPLCGRCWLKAVRGKVVARYAGQRRGLEVSSTHPVHGELFRGTIRAVGIVPHDHQPAVRWQISDHDSHDLGEHVGDYVGAEARLLAATAWADEVGPSLQADGRHEAVAGTD